MRTLFKDKKNLGLRISAFIFLSLLALFFVLPYFYMISNSLKPTREILMQPSNIFPKEPTLASYIKVLTESPFFLWFKNSVVITVTNTVIVLITSSLLGFVFSKYNFKFKGLLFGLILATMMIPAQATMIPGFLLITSLGLYNNILALIIPAFISAFGVFLCKQFIDEIPKELFESAMLDGASDFKIFIRIVLPAIRPALGSLTIFTFLGFWNDYLSPLIYLSSPEKQTLPLALSFFSSQHSTDVSAVMAASALIIIPVTIVFILFQKQFIKGITMTGMK